MANEGIIKEAPRAISADQIPAFARQKAIQNAQNNMQTSNIGQSPVNKEMQNSEQKSNWEQFIKNQFDFEIAEPFLNQYMSLRRKGGYDTSLLYKELFTAFTQGKGDIKQNPKFRDYIVNYIVTIHNMNLMTEVASYYEKNKLIEKVPSLFYKIYEIYYWGQGVPVDLEKAAKYLKESLEGNNTEENRAKLREIYAKLSKEDNEEKQTESAYERAVKEKIKGAATDYANYLMEHNSSSKAIPYFVADEEYQLAYYAVNIENFKSVTEGVKAFSEVSSSNKFKKSLQLMRNNFDDLKTILYATKPASYAGIFFRYFMFSVLYVLYHTFRLSPLAFVLALISVATVPKVSKLVFDLNQEGAIISTLISVILWGVILISVDIWRRYKFSKAEELWKRLEYHPQLESRKGIFDPELASRKNASLKLAFTGGVIITLLAGFGIQYWIIGDDTSKDKIKSSVEVTTVSDTKNVDYAESNTDTKNSLSTETRKEQNATIKPQIDTPEKSDKNSRQAKMLEQAKREIKEYGIDGNFISTSFGNSKDGFIAIDDIGDIVVVDRKNNRAGIVKPRISLKEFQNQKGRNEPYAMILDCTFFKEKKGKDADAGYWSGSTHYMRIQAAYKIERDHSVVPGMLKTGAGKNPSSLKTVLYETRNIDFVNLFLIEAMNIEL